MGQIPYVDAHCHAYGFGEKRLKELTTDTIIIGVAMDLETSLKLLDLGKNIDGLYPMIGIHPWEVPKATKEQLSELEKLLPQARGIGEVGLDGKTRDFEKQIEFFTAFVKYASEYDLPLNIHARYAWEEALNIVIQHDIERAIFHWYSGPTEYLRDIEAQGYYITINPSVIFQEKHLKVLEQAPMSIILTESDGPYQYRGRYLTPKEIPRLVSFIAKVKQTTTKKVKRIIYENAKNILSSMINKN